MVVLQVRAKCFVLQRIRVHYVTLQFNFNVQCYQNISRVLLTSAFTLLPPCTCGFGIQEKIRCVLRFFGVFLCSFAVCGSPLRPPPKGKITQFQYFKIKFNAVDIPTTRPWGINLTSSIFYSPGSHTTIYCFWL